MPANEQLIIRDDDGHSFLTVTLPAPFEPGKVVAAQISPTEPGDITVPRKTKFSFESSFDVEGLDLTPLAVLAQMVAENPAAVVTLARLFHESFSLRKKKKDKPKKKAVPSPTQRREPKLCDVRIALVVEGGCKGWYGQGVILDHAANDMSTRGYSIQRLTRPTTNEFYAALSDSCVKALVAIGHGTTADSGAGREDAALVFINDNEVVDPAGLRILNTPAVPLEIFILHACAQGAINNRAAWIRSAGVSSGNFHGWSGSLDPAQGLIWQWWY